MKPLLIEIGCEEIPARFISKGLESLRDGLTGMLEKSLIDYEGVKGHATPRRLAILIEGVAEKEKDRTTESLGPPVKAAFDSNGAPTKAAEGFARSLNLNVKDLKTKKTERGEYVAATITEKGKDTVKVLAQNFPGFISSLQVPKSMRWGYSSLRFFRPIHWFVALMGNEIIEFDVEGIKSGNVSYGHRFLSPGPIVIDKPSSYIQMLKQHHVIADLTERKNLISDGIKQIELSLGCTVNKDQELLDIVTNLVEYPVVVSGSFEDKYLALPKELLVTVMKSHQKYFSTEDSRGNMHSSFIIISNTSASNSSTVQKGAERVLRARLEDARFYYTEDLKTPLHEHAEKLKNVTFQEKLGSIHDKTERISSLAGFIANELNLKTGDVLKRASMLCKADLVTGVVSEFPELQGYMGMVYAVNSGEKQDTALAIHEHYLPKFSGDRLPSTEAGSFISIADKLDSIAAFFSVGLVPTGSEDPFALRRQAAGIIQILQKSDYSLPLDKLISRALKPLEPDASSGKPLAEKILGFFYQRLEGIFLTDGYSHDLISSVLSAGSSDIQDIRLRIDTLSRLKQRPEFISLLMAAKRVYNILSNAGSAEPELKLISEPAEKDLLSAATEVTGKLKGKDFNTLFELEKPINAFFEKVLVMDKNEQVKNNRLAILSTVKSAFDLLGDFSKIQE